MPDRAVGYADGVHQGTIVALPLCSLSGSVDITTGLSSIISGRTSRAVFAAMLAEAGVTVIGGELIASHPDGAHIVGLTLDRGAPIIGKVFIDASCDRDLMAITGASWTIGRE